MKKQFNAMLDLFKNQSGVAVIMVALSIFMLTGFTAFVVDAGSLYFEKSRLQKGLDAAVLGGAQVLMVSEGEAKIVATEIAFDNGFTIEGSEISTGDNYIEINKTVNKDLFFARVLGFNNADVSAYARAETIQTLTGGDGIVPVALEQGEYVEGEPYTMNFQPGNNGNASISGNFGFLAMDGPGGKELKEGIMYGSTLETYDPSDPDTYEWTQTGLSWGNVKAGFEYRIEEDKDNPDCASYQTADNTCSRVITVPMVETYEGANGKTMVKIIGFAAFWIESVNQHEVSGRFIEYVRGGTFGSGEDFGVSGVKLVN
ncbi:Tad domain-containing protein [Terrihalobacillus insolitus]|uniref:Tad domain-containing protein n=1 Tax=Terrihalobacillus insolitus TaxID=2950438 RepID=UPI0023418F6F|nr:Tad domain-containing protein [Terrihalobacillus insolitus]MDC3413855.1 Tad domain-containing protein [Terrihalobacillus insolitus]